MSTLARFAAVALAAVFLVACGDGSGNEAECGNLICEAGETMATCATDCSCGDGTLDLGEECDGSDFGPSTCETQGRGAGTLICNSDCTLNYSGCTVNDCGDGIVQEGEECDGNDLNEATCDSIGFSSGSLSCNDNCTFNPDVCCNNFCGSAGDTRCDGDLQQECVTGASSCLVWESTNCRDTDYICEDPDPGEAVCVCYNTCSLENDTRCNGDSLDLCTLEADGCLKWRPSTDCSVGGETCAVGPSGGVCVPTATGEDCADPYPMVEGLNVVAWNAALQDYLPTSPSCSTTSTTGPDVVLKYTAASNGFIDVAMDKPINNRFYLVASDSACGTTTPELLCLAEYGGTVQQGSFTVDAGTDYYIYVTDSTSGSNPLPNPFFVTITENDCGTFDASANNMSPANAAVTSTLSPPISVDFTAEMNTTVGTVTLTGDLGTNISYDLSTSPFEVGWTNDNRTMTIITGAPFPSGENITVSWTGLQDVLCANLATPPTWTFQIVVTPCTPGTAGMVGATQTLIPSTITSISEYFVAADEDPTGYVYVGGTAALQRIPKAGGTVEDIYTSTALTSTHLGYAMLIVGDDIFTLESKTTGTTGILWRISTDGGATWVIEDFATFPSQPTDDMRSLTYYDGRIYMLTEEGSVGIDTQVWSVDASAATLPTTAVLESSIPDERGCSALAMDDMYYYMACGSTERVVRTNRTTLASELFTDAYDMSSSTNSIYAKDLDADGLADVLYFQSYYEKGWFVCEPAGLPYVDEHFSFGTSSGSYGMGFDATGNTLWLFDDDTKEFVSVQ